MPASHRTRQRNDSPVRGRTPPVGGPPFRAADPRGTRAERTWGQPMPTRLQRDSSPEAPTPSSAGDPGMADSLAGILCGSAGSPAGLEPDRSTLPSTGSQSERGAVRPPARFSVLLALFFWDGSEPGKAPSAGGSRRPGAGISGPARGSARPAFGHGPVREPRSRSAAPAAWRAAAALCRTTGSRRRSPSSRDPLPRLRRLLPRPRIGFLPGAAGTPQRARRSRNLHTAAAAAQERSPGRSGTGLQDSQPRLQESSADCAPKIRWRSGEKLRQMA